VPVGSVAGLEYLVPKPDADHGYALIYGVPEEVTAIAELSGLNATPVPVTPGSVVGLANFPPNPLFPHEYGVM
jgi:hypothetical protein